MVSVKRKTRPAWIARPCSVFLLIAAVLGVCSPIAQAVYYMRGSAWSFAWKLPQQNANDLDIWVESPTYSADPFPSGWWSDTFDTLAVTHGDHDGDGDADTLLHYTDSTGTVTISDGETSLVGFNMIGADEILDAYWTWDASKVGLSEPITYEETEFLAGTELHAKMSFAPGFFNDHPNDQAGWTNIRAFVNVPEAELALANLNSNLDLNALSAYEVQPRADGPAGPLILSTDVIWRTDAASPLDVFMADLPLFQASPDFEALLVADVLIQGIPSGQDPAEPPTVVGGFWNLNTQIPEPTTMGLLALGGVALLRRRKA